MNLFWCLGFDVCICPFLNDASYGSLGFCLTYQLSYRPGLRSVVTGYLPSAVLKGFIYIVPFAMLGMAKLAGCVSGSKQEIKCCSMVFYFLVGNVFFLSLLSGSLLDEIGESFSNPKNFPSHLASAVSAQVSLVHISQFSWNIISFLLHVSFEKKFIPADKRFSFRKGPYRS